MDVPNSDLLFHYCSPATALSVLEHRNLWLSSTSNLNDYAEVVWAQNIILKQLAAIEKEVEPEYLEMLHAMLAQNAGLFFICCLSEDGDILSQWRAYAEDATGVSIGFDANQLVSERDRTREILVNNTPGITTCAIEYDISVQERLVTDILNEWKFRPKGGRTVTDIQTRLNALQIQFKNPAFSEEKEHRLVTSPLILSGPNDDLPIPQIQVMQSNMSGLKHRQAGGKVTSYFEYPFPASAVREIVLGPKNMFADFDFSSFMSLNDLRHVKVRRSVATYR